MRRTLVAVCAAFAASGCVVVSDGTTTSIGGPKTAALSTTLTAADVAWSAARGSNTISGQGIMRTRGGDVKTCAGLEASLVPDSAYARERLGFTYGPGPEGFGPRERQAFDPDPPAYEQSIRRTVCDAQGTFTFSNLPDGKYYVLVEVTWGAVQGGRYAYVAQQGGVMMGTADVKGGETRRLILSS